MYFLTWSIRFNHDPFGFKIIEPALEGFNFFGSYPSGPFEPEKEAHEAWDEVNRITAFRINLNEDVGGEERLFYPLPTVAPALFHALGGTIDRVAGLLEAFGQVLFLAGLGVNHQPGKLVFLAGGMGFLDWRWSGLHGVLVGLTGQKDVERGEPHKSAGDSGHSLVPVKGFDLLLLLVGFRFGQNGVDGGAAADDGVNSEQAKVEHL